ncbi:MAG: SpoIVB peptidase [Bacillota bacterium]|jgi:stage IV sporulation protein B
MKEIPKSPSEKILNSKFLAVLLLTFILFFGLITVFYYNFLSLSPYQKVVSGEDPELLENQSGSSSIMHRIVTQEKENEGSQKALGSFDDGIAETTESTDTETETGDIYSVRLSIANTVPIKTVKVQEVSPVYIVPGGQAIGILLQTNGVTVVGQSPVILEDGQAVYPAKDAGIEIGDFIISLNGQKVNTNKEVAQLIDNIGKNGQSLHVKLLRANKEYELDITPIFCTDSKNYRIGIYVRDNTAGVGTLTFYEPQTGKYGALGHEISDLNGKGSTNYDKGSIVRANIQGIKIGEKGSPGEKIGSFIGGKWRGSIEKNCRLGIFGRIDQEISNPFFAHNIQVALTEQVELGNAEIFTVLQGEKIEKFSIKIVKILPNYRSSGKGMIIEITDPDLLKKTGGIIQGMSGSPIIQNNRLVGAVTHVFVNNPQKGYACFAEWMLSEAGIIDE